MSKLIENLELLNNDHTISVLVVGDVMLDCYIYGQVKRISPEAPVPVFTNDNRNEMLGGAANVARNIASLGAHTVLVGVVGSDDAGQSLSELATFEDRLDANFLIDDERETTQKIRFIADRQQVMRHDIESSAAINNSILESLKTVVRNHIDDVQAIVISDYAKGVISRELVSYVVNEAKKRNIFVVADPKSSDPSLYSNVSALTPNLVELQAASDEKIVSDEEVSRAAEVFRERSNAENLIVTLGAKGALLMNAGGQHYVTPTKAREVFDVSGAGDTFISGLAVSVALGRPIEEAVELGNFLAGLAVSKIGTVAVTLKDISEYLKDSAGNARVIERHKLSIAIEGARARKQTIGFTNGCFDLLHLGHIRLLQDAKKHCDFLVVGVNSDLSVKRLKGTSRPIKNQFERTEILAALNSVDLVVIFEEDDPGDLISQICPHVLIKGADYQIEDVIGAEFVQQRGGYVHLSPLLDTYSTTDTIEVMQKS